MNGLAGRRAIGRISFGISAIGHHKYPIIYSCARATSCLAYTHHRLCYDCGRTFSTRAAGPLLYRQSRGYVWNNGNKSLGSRMWNLIPAPIKTFGCVAIAAAGFFFISVPAIIILGPPIALGVWWYGRKLNKIAQELRDQRWNNLDTYHMKFSDPMDIDFNLKKLTQAEELARNRILRALESNEQGLADALHIPLRDHVISHRLGFTEIEGVQYDYRASGGFPTSSVREKMQIVTFGLIDKDLNHRAATIDMVMYSKPHQANKMRIEITSSGYGQRHFVLDDFTNNDDVIITVKPKKH